MNRENLTWTEIKQRHPVGSIIVGTVAHHAPFGVFLDIGYTSVLGLIEIVDFVDTGRMSKEMYPPIGQHITAVVLGHTPDQKRQIWLSVKPSVLSSVI